MDVVLGNTVKDGNEVKDDIAGFLGVLIKMLDGNRIELKQTGLIERILEAVRIEGTNPRATPGETEALPADNSDVSCNHLCKCHWNVKIFTVTYKTG